MDPISKIICCHLFKDVKLASCVRCFLRSEIVQFCQVKITFTLTAKVNCNNSAYICTESETCAQINAICGVAWNTTNVHSNSICYSLRDCSDNIECQNRTTLSFHLLLWWVKINAIRSALPTIEVISISQSFYFTSVNHLLIIKPLILIVHSKDAKIPKISWRARMQQQNKKVPVRELNTT